MFIVSDDAFDEVHCSDNAADFHLSLLRTLLKKH